MDWGVALFYLSLTGTATMLSAGPLRLIGAALVANVIVSNVCAFVLPVSTDAGVAILTELAVFETATLVLVVTNRTSALYVAFLSTVSMMISALKALEFWPFFGYEALINGILIAQCVGISWRGLGDGVRRMGGLYRGVGRRRNPCRVPGNGLAAIPGSPDDE